MYAIRIDEFWHRKQVSKMSPFLSSYKPSSTLLKCSPQQAVAILPGFVFVWMHINLSEYIVNETRRVVPEKQECFFPAI
jgi:hypothetical protein